MQFKLNCILKLETYQDLTLVGFYLFFMQFNLNCILKLVEWGQATMVDADKFSLTNTVLDFSNKTFMLLSETIFFLILFLFLVDKSKSRMSQVTQVIWSSYQFLNLGPDPDRSSARQLRIEFAIVAGPLYDSSHLEI